MLLQRKSFPQEPNSSCSPVPPPRFDRRGLGSGRSLMALMTLGLVALGTVAPASAQAQSLQALYDAARAYDATYLAAKSLADSAQYKDLVPSRRYKAWCGQINSRNRLGGYVGWGYFAVRDRFRDLRVQAS